MTETQFMGSYSVRVPCRDESPGQAPEVARPDQPLDVTQAEEIGGLESKSPEPGSERTSSIARVHLQQGFLNEADN